MTFLKSKRILSLLLVLTLALSAISGTALAAEVSEETACSCEVCEHGSCEAENCECEACSTEASEDNETADPTPDCGLVWEVDEYGNLVITITGTVSAFTSADEQPWKANRNEIRSAYVLDSSGLTVPSIAYWFSGCESLTYAELSGNVSEIGYHAFYDCPNLRDVVLQHDTAPVLTQGAFVTLNPLNWQPDIDPRMHFTVYSEAAFSTICAYDWGSDNCPITVTKETASAGGIMTASLLAASGSSGYCSNCKKTCSYTVAYEDWTDSVHCIRYWCSNCGLDQCGGANAGSHSYNSSGYCTYCGHYNSAYDSSTCYHTSTTTTWSGCTWYKYCSNCGVLVSSGTSHGTTYTTWNGCKWYEYCNDCGTLMDSGTSHSYSYDESWVYYNTSTHRRHCTCTVCGATAYSYQNHSTSDKYTSYSSTQHQYGKYCSDCDSYVGSTTKVDHSFTYGSWTNYSSTQHRRSVSCSDCGYSSYEYSDHSLTPGDWTTTETEHRRTQTCSCGYSATESGAHTDSDGDGCCDTCGYLLTRFSVTVPASLSIAMSETGQITTATNAAIVNNSSGSVKVSSLSITAENGWTLVPYSSNMAAAKVDSKLIGFRINTAQSSVRGDAESISLGDSWLIAAGASLPLSYDAAISATSTAVTGEQILTLVFVVEWA